jgi:hypothetical protein
MILKAYWLTDSLWIRWLHKYQSHGECIMAEELKMTEKPTCACEAAIIGLYACSGGSNVGQKANRERKDYVYRRN